MSVRCHHELIEGSREPSSKSKTVPGEIITKPIMFSKTPKEPLENVVSSRNCRRKYVIQRFPNIKSLQKLVSLFLTVILIIFAVLFVNEFERPEEVASEVTQSRKNTIYLEAEKLSPSLLKVAVRAERLKEPIIGLAFDLRFDSEIMEFIEYRKGKFFERGGDPFYLSTLSRKMPSIVTGITLKRGDDLQKGTEDIIYFYFNILEDLNPRFQFVNTVVSTLEDGKRMDLDSVKWMDD